MYLELVCKFEDTYAVRDSEKGYMYLKEDEIKQRIAEVDSTERNCTVNDDKVVLKVGHMPVYRAGLNLVSAFNGKYPYMEYVFDIDAYIMSHTSTLRFDPDILTVIKEMGWTPVDLKQQMFKPLGEIGVSSVKHISELSSYIKVLLILHTVLENDNLCMINISSCDCSDADSREVQKFMKYLVRYKLCMLYTDKRSDLLKVCPVGVHVYLDTQDIGTK